MAQTVLQSISKALWQSDCIYREFEHNSLQWVI